MYFYFDILFVSLIQNLVTLLNLYLSYVYYKVFNTNKRIHVITIKHYLHKNKNPKQTTSRVITSHYNFDRKLTEVLFIYLLIHPFRSFVYIVLHLLT